jgi:hypothetical protein
MNQSPEAHHSAWPSPPPRGLDHTEFPYVYLDATYLNVRNTTSRVVSMAVVVATGIAADGCGPSKAPRTSGAGSTEAGRK